MFTEIQIYYMFEMLVSKINDTAGLAALTDALHHKRLVRGIAQPRLEYVFYLTPEHCYTFSYRLSQSARTFSCRLSVQSYTFSMKLPRKSLLFCTHQRIFLSPCDRLGQFSLYPLYTLSIPSLYSLYTLSILSLCSRDRGKIGKGLGWDRGGIVVRWRRDGASVIKS